ncbi:MAG: polyketide synthase [Planctomycetota bacterium]
MHPKLNPLHPKLNQLIEGLRARVRRYVVIDSLLAVAAVILTTFWAGFALDYLPVRLGGTEMPSAARALILLLAVGLIAYLLLRQLWGRLNTPMPDDALALLVERHHPSLGGRLVTAVQLMRDGRQGDAHAPDLLMQVHDQATEAIASVDPGRVFDPKPLKKKALAVGPLALLAIGFVAWNPAGFAQAASRLTLLSNDPWPRRAKLEMVGLELAPVLPGREDAPPKLVEFIDQVARLPQGSSPTLRIRAAADESKIVPMICTVYYETESGTRGQTNMRRIGRVRDGYQAFVLDTSPLAALPESVSITIQGLDDRLSDYIIEAVPPPVLTETLVDIRYPQYLRLDADPADASPDRTQDYQSGMRIREGSQVTLRSTSSTPLGEVLVAVNTPGRDAESELQAETPETFRLQISDAGDVAQLMLPDIREAQTVSLVPVDRDGIAAQTPYRYFLGVVRDEPPEIDVKLQGIGNAITPDARIPAKIIATDDYALRDLSLSALLQSDAPEPDGGESPEDAENNSGADAPEPDRDPPSHTQRPQVDRDGKAEVAVDLRQLASQRDIPRPAIGSVVTLVTEARYGYDIGEPHVTRAELIRLNVVTPDQLLALLERRELEMRARLEQTVTETTSLRDSLDRVRREIQDQVRMASSDSDADEQDTGDQDTGEQDTDEQDTDEQDTGVEPADATDQRAIQVLRLRIQQAGLQANKTSDELTGVVRGIEDLLEELNNNRVQTADRQTRLRDQVAQPLAGVISGPLQALRRRLGDVEDGLNPRVNDASSDGSDVDSASVDADSNPAVVAAVDSVRLADETLLGLSAVLEKMLDLESFNEILDLVRGLIDDQDELLEETKKEQKRRILDLFDN